MPTKFITKIFAAIICSIVFASTIHAQEKPQALKFDEFDDFNTNQFYSDSDFLSFEKRVERFKKQLRKDRGVRAYVLYYKARIGDEDTERELTRRVNSIQFSERYGSLFEIEVVTVDSGYRDFNSVEFWIVPKDAAPPVPTPTIDKAETYICPKVGVYGSYVPTEPNTLNFSVSTYDLRKTPQYTLKWKVFGGEIVGEKASDKIKVKLNNGDKRATAYAEIEGLPFPCPKVFSATATINGKLLSIDEFGRETNGYIKARLDNFFSELFNNPTAQAYIIIYGSRDEGKKYAVRREKLIRNQFAFRRVDTSRITFIDGGFRETEATEIWLSFDENEKPIPTPTVDAKFVGTPAVKKSISRKR